MPNKIKWIFFDVGGVIVDDDYYLKKYYQYLFEKVKKCGIKITKKEFERVRKEIADEYYPSIAKGLLMRLLCDERICDEIRKEAEEKLKKEFDKLIKLNKNAKEILKILKKKGYKLGLIANQTKEMIGFLKKHTIWDLFSFKAISEILNLWKPDIRIFRFALKGGRCKPSEAITVGDRIDNDIIPAKKLGMKTIRVRKGSFAHSNQEPKNENGKADITISSIDQLLEAIGALSCKD